MALLKLGTRIVDNLFNNKRLSNLTIYGNFAYLIDSSNNQILKKDLTTLASSILISYTGEIANNMTTDGINIYLSTFSNKIYRISLSNPTLYLFSSNTQLQEPNGLWIDSINNYIYVVNRIGGTISQLDLTTGTPSGSVWLSGLNFPKNIIGYNNYLYVSNSNIIGPNISRNNTISKISLTTKTIETFIDSTYLSSPSYLAIYQDYLYVCNVNYRNGENTILSINLTGDLIISRAYLTVYSLFTGISVYNNNIYTITGYSNDGINQHAFVSNEPPPLALVDNLSLSNSLINNYRLRPAITYGNFAYISDLSTNSILKMDLTTNVVNIWLPTLSQPLALATDGTYIYFSRSTANIIYRVLLSSNPTGLLSSYEWSTSSQLNLPSGLDISSNYLYVSNRTQGGDGTISKIDLLTGIASDTVWISGLYHPTRMKIYNDNLYVINSIFSTGTINTSMANTVSKIPLSTKIIETFIDSTNVNAPFALDIYNDYLYVTNNFPNFHGIFYITRKNLTGPPIITYGVSSLTQTNMLQSLPLGIFTYNNSIYTTTQQSNPSAINNINVYKEVSSSTPIPKNISYDSDTKILSWTPTGSYNSFIIHELETNYIITTNDVSFNFTTLLSQNSFITSFNFVVRQVTSGAIGPESNRYRVNLLKPTNLFYDTNTKLLSWVGSLQRDYYIIRDLSKNLELYSQSANNINLSSFLFQNPSIRSLNITVQDVTNGVIGPASIPYTINTTPAPTNLSYNTTTKELTWIGYLPYESFIIEESTRLAYIGNSNDTLFNLTTYISQNPSFTTLNITVKQISSSLPSNAASITINLSLPQSNICFIEGTIIETDQGEIPIEMITNENTINNLKVLEVTKTISMDESLICIEKDCLGLNFPNKKTVVSQNHQFLFNGHLVKAKYLNNVFKIPYNREILYNVLLEENSFMIANNLICETLDVNNVIAHLYRSPNRIEITKLLNAAKDFEEYKQIALTHLM